MKRVLFATGLLAALTLPIVQAQGIQLTASIPFEFRVGETLMPAGDYQIDSRTNYMRLRQENGDKKAVVFLTNAETRPSSINKSVLVFNRYGDGYFLSQIWSKLSPNGRVLTPAKLERELARGGRPAEAAMVAMQRR